MENDRHLAVAIALIFLASLAIRLSIIEIRPLHHDEGVDAISFVKPLYENGEYRYSPRSPYHGPFLYYANALAFRIFGVNEFALRFFSILFVSTLVLLLYPLRKRIGSIGTIAAAAFLAISPVFLYYSTYSSSHELPFMLFQLAAIGALFLYMEKREKKYLYAFFSAVALMFTTKETAYVITGAAMLFFAFEAYPKRKAVISHISNNLRHFAYATLAAFVIFAAFYTSFLKYPDNLLPAITDTLPSMLSFPETYKGHEKPFFYYTELLAKFELPLLVFALIGMAHFRKSLFSKFSAYVLVSAWLLFSTLAYKTPWNILHIMLPLAIVAGIGVQGLYSRAGKLAVLALVIGLVYTSWISYNTNYVNHSGQFNELAYVTTTPELLSMVNRIYTYNTSTEIKVLSNDYWPLPWYLRDYKSAGYYGKITDNPDADVVIIKKEDRESLNLTGVYESADYQLRYGVWLTAFFRSNQTA